MWIFLLESLGLVNNVIKHKNTTFRNSNCYCTIYSMIMIGILFIEAFFPIISIYGMIEIRYKGRKEQILKRMEWR